MQGGVGEDLDRAFRVVIKNKLWAMLDNIKRGGVESRDAVQELSGLVDEYIVLRRLIECQRLQKSG